MNLGRQGLHAVDGQEGLIVQRVYSQSVGILLAGKLTRILVQAVQPRVIAAARQRQRQTSEGEQLELDLGTGTGDGANRIQRQFDRRADGCGAVAQEEASRRLIVDIEERAGDEWPAAACGQGGDVV